MSRTFRFLVLVVLALAACSPAAPAVTNTPAPTNTLFPTRIPQEMTAPPLFATLAAATQTAAAGGGEATAEATEEATVAAVAVDLDPVMVERGRGRYEALECASCHGDNGEGTEDGSVLIGLALTEAEFIDFMRSGGEMGVDHQYSTDRLSPNGGRNLYQYLLSLGQNESE